MDGPVSSLPERRPDDPLDQPLQPALDEPGPQHVGPASDEPPGWAEAAPVAGTDVDRRLTALEAGMAELGRRLERVGESVEESVRTAVSGELRAATADLRHTVSELGRLLVRDLGKLAQLLADHRDTIVAELRPPAGGASVGRTDVPGPGSAGARGLGAPGGDAPMGDIAGDTAADAAGGDPGGDPGDSTGEHRRGRLRRRNG